MKPIIVVNFKTYKESSGKNSIKLAKSLKDAIIAVQPADICETSKVHQNIYCQHVDSVEQGRGTGYLTIEDLIANGACGSLLNHSAHTFITFCAKSCRPVN